MEHYCSCWEILSAFNIVRRRGFAVCLQPATKFQTERQTYGVLLQNKPLV